ncbi:MAG TPA: hypothetical protein VGN12_00500 [Pirellulales bacterium]|jgi:hypothetical protein
MRRLTTRLGLLVATILCQSLASAEDAVGAGEPKVLASVGDELILERDVVPFVDQVILDFEQSKKIPVDQHDNIRKKLTEGRINHLIEIKLVMLDVRKQIPSEQFNKIKTAAGEEFERKEIPKKLRKQGLQSRDELVASTANGPMSLDNQKQSYIENAIALSWIATHTPQHPRPTTELERVRNKMAGRYYLKQLREQYPVNMLADE